jgi:hypothetical protein
MRYFIRIIILFFPAYTHASLPDSTSGTWNLSLRGGYGFIIAHRPALEPLQQAHVKGFEMTLARPTFGKKDWENFFHFPDYGITLAAFDLGSPQHLGTGIALYPFVDFPLGQSPGQGLHFRYGMGLGYVEKIFDATDNIKNAAIGSHVNAVIHFDLHYEKKLSPRSALEMGAGITHYSNGSYSLPNLGINIATANLALRRSFGTNIARVSRPALPFSRNPQLLFHLGGFLKKVYPPLGKNYFAGALSGLYLKPVNAKSTFGGGLDVFYDPSISARIDRLGEKRPKAADDFRPGLYGAYHFSLNHIGLMFNMGYYLYNGWKDDGNIYHRICLNYYFEKIFLCMNLKTHYARADMVELGIGYRIITKNSQR